MFEKALSDIFGRRFFRKYKLDLLTTLKRLISRSIKINETRICMSEIEKENTPQLMSENLSENGSELEGYYEEPQNSLHRILDYFQTKKGDIILGRVLKVLEEIAPTAKTYLDAKSNVIDKSVNFEYNKWWWLLIVRFWSLFLRSLPLFI